MTMFPLKVTYIGGPTALLEIDGLRLLTDPAFDRAGTEYRPGPYVLRKTEDPAIAPAAIGKIDIVLLSHDHHFDNLDTAGRTLLPSATRVLTTQTGAERLGGNATGLSPWQSVEIHTPSGRTLRVTGTPARHGPVGGDRGPVVGFVLSLSGAQDQDIYISGDTVWFEGVEEVAAKFSIGMAFLFMGAARIPEVGSHHLTLTAEEGILFAKKIPNARLVPLHFEGWAHFSESRKEIQQAFSQAGLEDRLLWLKPERAQEILP